MENGNRLKTGCIVAAVITESHIMHHDTFSLLLLARFNIFPIFLVKQDFTNVICFPFRTLPTFSWWSNWNSALFTRPECYIWITEMHRIHTIDGEIVAVFNDNSKLPNYLINMLTYIQIICIDWKPVMVFFFAIYNHETIGTVACRSITLRDRRTP